MLLIDKPTTCLNWQYIDKEKFPVQFDNSNVKEDFELLFQQNFDPVKLKELLRRSTREPNQAARKFLWKRILLQDSTQTQITIEKYNKKIGVLFGKNLTINAELPSFVSADHSSFYYLNEEGKAAVCRILNVLASVHPDITYAPLLLPLASLFLHYMSEAEGFACLLSVVESNNKVTQTDIHWTTTNQVFRRFAQRYARISYQFLLDALFEQTQDLDLSLEVIDDWQWWIFEHLPFNYVLNIVDSFLLEGQKVLYRYGISLLEFFFKSFSTQHSRPSRLMVNAMNDFCRKITVPQETLIKAAFGLRNMRRKDIDLVFQAEEKAIKKMRAKSNTVDVSFSYSNSSDVNCMDFSKSMRSKHMNSTIVQEVASTPTSPETAEPEKKPLDNTLQLIPQSELDAAAAAKAKDKEAAPKTKLLTVNINSLLRSLNMTKKWPLSTSKSISHHLAYHHHYPQSQVNLPSFSLENTGSCILTPQQIAQLWRWLPTRYQILDLSVIYSTNIHGCRLMTLFDKIEYYQATILVIQTTNNAIFGAFCSQPWSNRITSNRYRRPSFFGNGETFLFELKPGMTKYDWVGKDKNGNTTANEELFLYADHEKLIIGGGSSAAGATTTPGSSRNSATLLPSAVETNTSGGTGGVGFFIPSDENAPPPAEEAEELGMGLVIDADLLIGRTAKCDTFRNKVLGGQVDFEIAVLEVLSFNSDASNYL